MVNRSAITTPLQGVRSAGSRSQPLPILIGPGFVYFALAEELDVVKIGWTNQVDRRIANLRGGSPVDLKLALVLRGSKAFEAGLHHRYRSRRQRGEWFRDGAWIVADVIEHCGEGVR